MDVQTQQRGPRIFSILNDNDCPSFVIRHQQPSSPASVKASPSISLRQRVERPHLPRQAGYTRASSFSSTASTPPLLRQSSSESSSSMDSSPSPITPAYSYVDNTVLPYDPLLRQDLTGYLPSPSTITPFMEQQLMIAPNMTDPYQPGKANVMPSLTLAQYPIIPTSIHPSLQPLAVPSPVTLPTPPMSAPAPSNQATTSPTTSAAPPTKKNKYPCPYSQSHNCQATFTTSGHAARHGKKHTGEKGVHCPVCNKAFTRKDNMKQHERTHKGSQSGSNSDDSARRSKAAITKDAQKAKPVKTHDSSRRSSLIHSPLSEVTSLAPTAVETPVMLTDESAYYPEPPQMLMPIQTIPEGVSPNSLYPALGDDTLLNCGPMLQQSMMHKSAENGLGGQILMPPMLIRGFSDLDTLAQAAEAFDPYYPQS
ncbi:hypothetical protein LTR47_007087 [Exophiala xenobiotica]|nr:hypothetical protein LTR47_007087 [Exophiala xenobiotica]KAK5252895.1 hypothetical protein LTS06_002607 [Exophiala xenobiotica]KAK5353771.1 hypothetical protein LTR61_002465 [Exophiala xenobiotica]KAK5366762.1 hypothetical protein LTS03_008675 [Exophiala xenobiotica]KAK5370580.1 hypothetical protein LTR11_006791 [Exophiala xenobiotica]